MIAHQLFQTRVGYPAEALRLVLHSPHRWEPLPTASSRLRSRPHALPAHFALSGSWLSPSRHGLRLAFLQVSLAPPWEVHSLLLHASGVAIAALLSWPQLAHETNSLECTPEYHMSCIFCSSVCFWAPAPHAAHVSRSYILLLCITQTLA